MFLVRSDAMAASKLKTPTPVPTYSFTVTDAARNRSPIGFEVHASEVAEFQEDVEHAPRSFRPPLSSDAVAVASPTPKFSPSTVNAADPLSGVFTVTAETTGASKLNVPTAVPAIPPTVTHTVTSFGGSASTIAVGAQLTEVAESQLEVAHAALDSIVECVCSSSPKFSPRTVMDAYPLSGVFRLAPVTAGASKLNTWNCVPTTEPTVVTSDSRTRSANWLPMLPALDSALQYTEVPDVHDVESHSKCVYVAL